MQPIWYQRSSLAGNTYTLCNQLYSDSAVALTTNGKDVNIDFIDVDTGQATTSLEFNQWSSTTEERQFFGIELDNLQSFLFLYGQEMDVNMA